MEKNFYQDHKHNEQVKIEGRNDDQDPSWNELAFFACGLLLVVLRLGAIWMTFPHLKQRFGQWWGGRCPKRLRLVRNARHVQKVPKTKKISWSNILVVYFLLWHDSGVLAMDVANSLTSDSDDPLERFENFEPGETQYVQSLISDVDNHEHYIFRVWVHGHGMRGTQVIVANDIMINPNEPLGRDFGTE